MDTKNKATFDTFKLPSGGIVNNTFILISRYGWVTYDEYEKFRTNELKRAYGYYVESR